MKMSLSKVSMPKSKKKAFDDSSFGAEEGSPEEEASEPRDEAMSEGDLEGESEGETDAEPSKEESMGEHDLTEVSDDDLMSEIKKRGLMSDMNSDTPAGQESAARNKSGSSSKY